MKILFQLGLVVLLLGSVLITPRPVVAKSAVEVELRKFLKSGGVFSRYRDCALQPGFLPMSSKRASKCKAHEKAAKKVLVRIKKKAARNRGANAVVDAVVKEHLAATGKKNRAGAYKSGLDLHSFYKGLQHVKKPSLKLPLFVRSGRQRTPNPITVADIMNGLTLRGEMKAKEEALLKEIYVAAGATMKIDESQWAPYREKLAAAKRHFQAVVKAGKLPKKSRDSTGEYAIDFARKHVLEVYPRAKIREAYMYGYWTTLSPKHRDHGPSYQDRWGVIFYSLPGEDSCRKAKFNVKEKGRHSKFRKAKDVKMSGETFLACP